jgi:hypothetical protein
VVESHELGYIIKMQGMDAEKKNLKIIFTDERVIIYLSITFSPVHMDTIGCMACLTF